ncbi:hypothetical protein M431DRAFT_534965 [Trichoderma harzianum CBS 226.95]|uniref:Uncharacterized protein n=1 Tax=Trichoderma harzianum CBS 226.95 TaxID=983964 RepID=A0A2T3ZX35_TRIHA|nr:hypothetical protein M431DRAFT_534965 [Trichoderma harzianum CBS 226.95]PTB49293.1 hypothetical protein M431DRAFT_534965 [Trichoderma harzianum CBS 226.95]
MAMISKIDNDDIEDPSQWQYVKRPAYAHPLRLNAWHRTRGKRWAVRPHGVLHGGIASPNGDPDAGHHGSAHSASVVGHGACRRLLYCCRCSALGAALMCDNAFDVDIFHDDTSSTVLASFNCSIYIYPILDAHQSLMARGNCPENIDAPHPTIAFSRTYPSAAKCDAIAK